MGIHLVFNVNLLNIYDLLILKEDGDKFVTISPGKLIVKVSVTFMGDIYMIGKNTHIYN